MHPWVMAGLLAGFVGLFAVSSRRRYQLLKLTRAPEESRVDSKAERLGGVLRYALLQRKMHYYPGAGLAHQLIFLGFAVLLLRTLMLWGRGFEPSFNLFVFGPEGFLGLPLGDVYGFLKDVFAVLVLGGVAGFVYYRVVKKLPRMTLGLEGLVILGIIAAMMLADITYDGATLVLLQDHGERCSEATSWCQQARQIIAPLAAADVHPITWRAYPDPAGSAAALLMQGWSVEPLVIAAQAGFWTHTTLVLVFLNILPYSKHFHILTAIPNVFFGDLTKPGRLKPMAESTEALMAKVEQAAEHPEQSATSIGQARIGDLSWKDALDLFSCTECGRCSDHCPAYATGKKLSPKQLILDLRNHLYAQERTPTRQSSEAVTAAAQAGSPGQSSPELVPTVIDPDVLWACTTCRACEEQCPVMITHLQKILPMRRHLVMMRGEFPAELAKPFEGMEVNGNPWNLARSDRSNWASGLGIPFLAAKPKAEVLFWVGCAASYDDRAKKVARSTALLLKEAGVDFAILGDEENCTGDPARRAGNEYLFMTLAEGNITTLNGYQAQGGVKTIVTTCPHCFNTLLNEYADFGGRYEVVHHTDYLLGLVRAGRLQPKHEVKAKVTYHDPCYLGRHNGVYDSPRALLESVPGIELVESAKSRHKGLCCGAGGAQMFLEEQNQDRMNVRRTDDLLLTKPDAVATACPFCMTMLTDGLKAREREHEVRQLDVAELLRESCGLTEAQTSGG